MESGSGSGRRAGEGAEGERGGNLIGVPSFRSPVPNTGLVPVPNDRYALSYAAFLARDALRLGAAEDYFLLAIHNAPADPAPHMAYADFAETVCELAAS